MKKAAQKNEPMNILVLADHESKYLYDYYEPEKLKDVDLIISCGDLEANYLCLCFMLWEITTGDMNLNRRRDVSALKMTFLCTRGSGFWDWEALWSIFLVPATSIRSGPCDGG